MAARPTKMIRRRRYIYVGEKLVVRRFTIFADRWRRQYLIQKPARAIVYDANTDYLVSPYIGSRHTSARIISHLIVSFHAAIQFLDDFGRRIISSSYRWYHRGAISSAIWPTISGARQIAGRRDYFRRQTARPPGRVDITAGCMAHGAAWALASAAA